MSRSALRWTIPTFLALQLGLLWVQGAQLHRQNQVLEGLREDLQALAESIENNQAATSTDEEVAAVPAHFLQQPAPQKKVAVLGAEDEQEPAAKDAAKDLQASRDSALKAVKDAREVQSKLSYSENARKVDEARKIQGTTNSWQRWFWAALGLILLALVARSVIRRRG